MQRLTKYPLLLRNILKSTPENHADHSAMQLAVETVEKEIMLVNDAVLQQGNERRLAEVMALLDCSELEFVGNLILFDWCSDTLALLFIYLCEGHTIGIIG
jgi:hypothetical protein